MNFEIKDRIRELVLPFLKQGGFELVDIILSRRQGGYNLNILIDKTCGGINLKECSCLNLEIGEILDRENVFPGRYYLEICSPGLDRPLIKDSDFKRAIKRKVRVFLKEKLENNLELEGVLNEVKEEKIVLETMKGILEINFDKILKAKQVIK